MKSFRPDSIEEERRCRVAQESPQIDEEPENMKPIAEDTLSDVADYLIQILEDLASIREEVKQLKVMICIRICHTPEPRTVETFWGGGRHVQYHNNEKLMNELTRGMIPYSSRRISIFLNYPYGSLLNSNIITKIPLSLDYIPTVITNGIVLEASSHQHCEELIGSSETSSQP
uniref:Uncharacterized protein n=1 Tax=Lactuca sativa TaxID=4236 RepID=A0A9R1VGD2_LACSA|nr:hypothetical protein LSAT_V11C500278330 [Lactuca sativa]